MKKFYQSECQCDRCKRACNKTRPCWGTPKDILKIINAGYGKKLMLDWWGNMVGDEIDFYMIVPAIKGYESYRAPIYPIGECTFYKDGLCELHNLKLKPLEGRLASIITQLKILIIYTKEYQTHGSQKLEIVYQHNGLMNFIKL